MSGIGGGLEPAARDFFPPGDEDLTSFAGIEPLQGEENHGNNFWDPVDSGQRLSRPFFRFGGRST